VKAAGLEERHASARKLPAEQGEHGAPVLRHLVRGVDVREAGERRGAEVTVCGVDDELHGSRERLVREALGGPGGGPLRARLRREALLDQAIDETEEHAEPVARGTDAVLTHQGRIEARDVRLHHALGDARGEQVERRARVLGAVAALVSGERGAGAKVRAHDQRIDHASGRTRVGQALVATRHHAREREGSAAEETREPRGLVHVVERVAADTPGVAAIHLVDARADDELPLRRRETEVTRDGLEAMARKIPRREIVPAHGVHRVDQLATRHRVPRPTQSL